MSARLVVAEVDKEAYAPLLAMEKYVHSGHLGEELLALVKVRASQLNGCAFCLDMHATEGRKAGLDQRKLDVVAGWHEAPQLYTARERAALRSEEHTSELQSRGHLVCRLLLEKKHDDGERRPDG